MKKIGAYKAKTQFSKLLESVGRGESIVITKHGNPVALLQPFDSKEKTNVKETVQKLKAFRQKNKLSGLSIRNMIEEGRK